MKLSAAAEAPALVQLSAAAEAPALVSGFGRKRPYRGAVAG
jgi:hypothetical protein